MRWTTDWTLCMRAKSKCEMMPTASHTCRFAFVFDYTVLIHLDTTYCVLDFHSFGCILTHTLKKNAIWCALYLKWMEIFIGLVFSNSSVLHCQIYSIWFHCKICMQNTNLHIKVYRYKYCELAYAILCSNSKVYESKDLIRYFDLKVKIKKPTIVNLAGIFKKFFF